MTASGMWAHAAHTVAAGVISNRTLTGADGVTFILRENDQCHYVDEDAIGPLSRRDGAVRSILDVA